MEVVIVYVCSADVWAFYMPDSVSVGLNDA